MFQISQGRAPTGVINAFTWKLLQAVNDHAEEKILGAESPSNVGAIIDGLQKTVLAAVAMDLQTRSITHDIKPGFLAALAGMESGWGARRRLAPTVTSSASRTLKIESPSAPTRPIGLGSTTWSSDSSNSSCPPAPSGSWGRP